MSDNWAGDGQERLLARVREYVLQGDEASVEQVLTNCTKLLRHLTHENAALREFVTAYDNIEETLLEEFPDDNFIVGIIPAIRQRLATDHGLPLPGEEVGS